MVRVQSHLTKYVKIGQIGFHTVQFDKTKIDSQKNSRYLVTSRDDLKLDDSSRLCHMIDVT